MKKRFPILLTSFIGSAIFSHQTVANLADQCLLGVPTYKKPLVSDNGNSLPVFIQSDKASLNYPDHTIFSNNVDIKYGNSTLTADEVQITQRQEQNHAPLRMITATGNVNYSSNEIKLQGIKAWSNLNTKDTDVYHGNYQMVGRQGRGKADTIKQRKDNRYTVLKNGSFTSCLPGDNSWSIVGSEVIYDRKEQIAEIWNARFKIGKLPIFYSPYLQMPMGNQRRSGFFFPNAKHGNNNGFEFSSPYYLNLATNYDATITPNYMSERGTQIQTEFRYLTIPGDGLVECDWLAKDRAYSNKHASDSARWLFYWHHNGIMNHVWRFNINYTKVSDSKYFDDLDSKYGSTTDGYATQKFSFGYANENWDTALSYKQFQVFDIHNNNTYRATPQLDVTYYKNDVGPFNYKVFSQAVKFNNVNHHYPETTRLHIEPTINLPLTNRWGRLNTEAKLMVTHFQQENIDTYNKNTNINRHLKNSVTRVLPQFKTDGNIVFERSMDFAPEYRQTLEPRVLYLYVPYRNQNDISVNDSTILKNDYFSLFRDRTYSGLDRISSKNQLVGSFTTRIYDDQRMERFNASLGQIYYFFSWPKTENINFKYDNDDHVGILVWAGDTYWQINNQYGVRSSLQYDSRLNSNATLEYRRDKNHIIQLKYRYASPQYSDGILSDISYPSYQQGISQVGLTSSWQLLDRLSLVVVYYLDTKANQPTDQLIGFQYSTCCWAFNVGYERKIAGWNNTDRSSQYDNKISFNIELRGSSNHYGLGTDKMLTSGILPYQPTF